MIHWQVSVGGGILSNGDIDGGNEGTPLDVTVILIDSTDNEFCRVKPDGSFTYIPGPGFSGVAIPFVAVCDQGIPLPEQCTNDTIIITIDPVNDAPVANPDTVITPANGTVIVIDPQINRYRS